MVGWYLGSAARASTLLVATKIRRCAGAMVASETSSVTNKLARGFRTHNVCSGNCRPAPVNHESGTVGCDREASKRDAQPLFTSQFEKLNRLTQRADKRLDLIRLL